MVCSVPDGPNTNSPQETVMVKTERAPLVALFVAMGVATAATWKNSRLKDRAQNVKKYLEEGTALTDEQQTLFNRLAAAQDKKEAVEVTGPDLGETAAPKPQTPEPAEKPRAKPAAAGKAGAGKKAAGNGKPKRKATGGWDGKTPLPFSDRGPGVIKFIVEELKAAGKAKKPISLDALHAKLAKEFDDRDSDALKTTLRNQVPSRLRIVRGIHVWSTRDKDGTKYWIEGEGKTEQPAGPKPAPAVPKKPAGKPVAKKTVTKKPAGKPVAKKKPVPA
jgi:hypothetical protein